MGQPLTDLLEGCTEENRLNIGCIAAHGYFYQDSESGDYEFLSGCKPATAFLLRLISQLQFSGTVPMIDVQAYAEWLTTDG